MISIQTNTDSLNAQQNLNVNHAFQSNTIKQLTSGYRINSSADDAAGLAIANSYRSKVAELNQGVSNANDGVSQLQIIDGGLSNISTILDRMKTLATQSASATFTGNRSVLNQEYTGLLSEINRQATNVNLNAGGTFNSALSVYIGGANTSDNAKISIDLSGASNAVDSVSLGLATSSVSGGGTSVAGNTLNLTTEGAKFVQGTSPAADQTFTFNIADPKSGAAKTIQATVAATAGGSSLSEVLSSLNKQLSPYGIAAGTSTSGALQFGGTTAFTVSDNATVTPPAGGVVTGTSTGTNLLTNQSTTAGNGVAENTANYLVDGKSSYVPPAAGGSETLSFTSSSGATINVNLTNATTGASAGDTLAHALSSINAATGSYGIHAVANAAGTGITFQSTNTFSVNSTKSAGTVAATAPPAGATAATFTGNTTNLNSAPPSLANGSQVFTFNVAKSDGSTSAVKVSLAGGANGLSASQVVSGLNTAIAAQKTTNSELGTITASLDSNNKLVFTGGASNTAFSVNAAAATVDSTAPAGTTTSGVVSGTGAAENTTNHTADLAYALNPSAATTILLDDKTSGGPITLTVAANKTIGEAIKSINTQLAANATPSTTKAVLGSDGASISFQNVTATLSVGATASNATSASSTFSGVAVDLTSGTYLAAGDSQAFTFNSVGANGVSDSYTLTLTGSGAGGSGSAAATALSTAITAAVTAGHTGLSGITVTADATGLHFAGNGALTVKAGTATGTALAANNATATNTSIATSTNQTYVGAGTAYKVVINDGSAKQLSVSATTNTSVGSTVTDLNKQLIASNSTVRAVVASNGIDISFQNAVASSPAFTFGGVASNSSTAVAGGFGATNTNALQSGNFLAGGAQTFTFNLAKADGTSSAVDVTLNGGTTGIAAGDVLASLNAAITTQAATNKELGSITAALDSNNQIVFNGGAANTAFTVSTKGATAGAVGIVGAGSAENTGDHVVDQAYGLSSAPQTIDLKDGTGTTGNASVTIAANSNVASAVTQINTQLKTQGSSTVAVASADGNAISFQNATNTLSLGGTQATATSSPVFASGGTVADLSQNGAFLKNSATQVLTFNIANSGTGALESAVVTLNGGAGGITGAAAVAQINSQLQTLSAVAGHGDLANIVAGLNASNKLTFTNATGTAPAFSATVAAPSAGTGLFNGATSNVENRNDYYTDIAAGALTNINVSDSLGKNTSLTTSGSVTNQIGQINAAFIASGSNVRAVSDAAGTGISFQSSGAFAYDTAGANTAATAPAALVFANAGSAQDLSKTGDFLQGGSQTFTFNVVGANGANDAVALQLNGGSGLTGAAVVTGLQSLINSNVAAHPGLANIVVGQNATTNQLTFTTASGTTSPFTVSVGGATAGTGVFSTSTANVENTNLKTFDQSYTASSALSLVVNDGKATTLSLTAAQNTSLSSAVGLINQQLKSAGSSITALVSGDGTKISFQSTNGFKVGGTASNPTTTQPASISTNSVKIQSGPFLAAGATQAFTFNVVDPTSKASTAYSINVSGGANGLTSQKDVLAAVNAALATAVAGTPAANGNAAIPPAPGLTGIKAAVDPNGQLSFSGAAGQAFTVKAGVAGAGAGLTSNATAASSDNSALYAIDQTFTASTTPTAKQFTVGGKTGTVTIAANSTIDQQIQQTNVQLSAAGITNLSAVKSGDGTGISYQSSAAFSIGIPDASGVFNGSTPAGTTTNAAVVPPASQSGLSNAESAINAVNSAIKSLGLIQGSIGSGQNKLQYAINLAQSQISNFSAAESQIRDTDVAKQAANLTKSQVLTQTSIAAMAQANQEPQSVLKLLQ